MYPIFSSFKSFFDVWKVDKFFLDMKTLGVLKYFLDLNYQYSNFLGK